MSIRASSRGPRRTSPQIASRITVPLITARPYLDPPTSLGADWHVSWAEALGRTVLFREVSPEVLSVLAARAVHRRYRRSSVIFVQGDHGSSCYAILSGSVRICTYTADGREAVLAVLGEGDVFGELALFDEAPRSADAIANEAAELLCLDERDVHRAIADHPELAASLLRILGRRLRLANDAFQEVAFFDVPGRVAKRLADLAATHGVAADGGILIDVSLSQESLANMVGATRESVNKALAALGKRGLVERRGRRYLLPDVEALRGRAR